MGDNDRRREPVTAYFGRFGGLHAAFHFSGTQESEASARNVARELRALLTGASLVRPEDKICFAVRLGQRTRVIRTAGVRDDAAGICLGQLLRARWYRAVDLQNSVVAHVREVVDDYLSQLTAASLGVMQEYFPLTVVAPAAMYLGKFRGVPVAFCSSSRTTAKDLAREVLRILIEAGEIAALSPACLAVRTGGRCCSVVGTNIGVREAQLCLEDAREFCQYRIVDVLGGALGRELREANGVMRQVAVYYFTNAGGRHACHADRPG